MVQVGNVPNQPRQVNLAPIVSKEIQLRGTFRFIDEIDDAVALLASSSEFDHVITHEFALDDSSAAFAIAADASLSAKVMVRVE